MKQLNRHMRQTMGLLLTILTLCATMLTTFTNPPTAQASVMTNEMVDAFTMQVKRENTDEWETLPAEGGKVGVYDQVRYVLNFHVPQGTLNEKDKTLSVDVLMDGEQYGWMWESYSYSGSAETIAEGRIIMGGVDCGTYKVMSYGTEQDPQTGKYERNLRITFTFDDDTVAKNRTLELEDGILFFDWNANRLVKPDPNITLSVAGHDISLEVQAPEVSLAKRAIGEPDIDYKRGLVTLHWETDIENTGTLPLYKGWKLTDNLYELTEGNEPPANVTANGSGYWGFSRTEGDSYGGGYAVNTLDGVGIEGLPHYGGSVRRPADSKSKYFWQTQYFYNISQLDAGQKVTLNYDTIVPIDTNLDRYVNRIRLESNYVSTLVATAEQPNPASGIPYLAFSKKKVSLDNPDNCHIGDAGCRPRYKWEATVKNTGDGIMGAGWQIVDYVTFDGLWMPPIPSATR